MTIFVLVHGAWSGAHGFRHVRKGLQVAGHEVFTPSLTGIGERAHLTGPMVNLSTHVRDVVNQIFYEDLQNIVLVGFSYGGFVVTAALEHISTRVQHLVFLDAFVPKGGETAAGHIFGMGRPSIAVAEEWLMPSAAREFDNQAEGDWIGARRVPHPRGCFSEAIYLAKPLEEFAFSRTYVKATANRPCDVGADALWRAAKVAERSSAWKYVGVETSHMMASNRPTDVVNILLDVAKGS